MALSKTPEFKLRDLSFIAHCFAIDLEVVFAGSRNKEAN